MLVWIFNNNTLCLLLMVHWQILQACSSKGSTNFVTYITHICHSQRLYLPPATQNPDLCSVCHQSPCLLLGRLTRREERGCDPAWPSHLHEKAHTKGSSPNHKYACEKALIGSSGVGCCGVCESVCDKSKKHPALSFRFLLRCTVNSKNIKALMCV